MSLGKASPETAKALRNEYYVGKSALVNAQKSLDKLMYDMAATLKRRDEAQARLNALGQDMHCLGVDVSNDGDNGDTDGACMAPTPPNPPNAPLLRPATKPPGFA